MPVDRSQRLSRHYVLGDLLVDSTFPELAADLDPDEGVLDNLSRLSRVLDVLCDQFPPGFTVVSGYRDPKLNEACRAAGLPASVQSLHLFGCAADLKPRTDDIDQDAVFEWLRVKADDLYLQEAVFYPMKGFIHVAIADRSHPKPQRILMRT